MQVKPWDGKLHKKIDFYRWDFVKCHYEYVCSTNQSRTLREAAQKFYDQWYEERYKADGKAPIMPETLFKITFSDSPKWFNLLPLVRHTGREAWSA